MVSHPALLLIAIFFSQAAFAQIGGKTSYQFLDVPVNAHVSGIGGVNISVRDQDPNMVMQNPALLNSSMNKYFSVSYLPYYANIKANSLSYVQKIRNNMFGASLQYLGYGNIQQTDANGTILGTFNAREFAFTVSGSHTINHYTIGANLKLAESHIYTYNSAAILADIGAIFKHPKKEFTIGLVMKNIGVPIQNYVKGHKTVLPFDVQLGTTFKPEHMPLRFSFTADHLQQFDIVYQDTTIKTFDLQGNQIIHKKTFADKAGRHLIVGGELILSKNFHVRVGYNYLRRRELRVASKSGGAGFSWGFMLRIKSFEFGFSRAYYYSAGGTSFLTLTTNFETLMKKKSPSINNTNQN
ncbi:MAG TPA: type IX secretion system protein PorQ [Cytophagaceae bacterium]|jgi:hypothetical protein|nr:type IX secretion system protein PorQ [Cytophagaceae bacterium]